MIDLHAAIAALLAGVGIYSIIATLLNSSYGCGGRCSLGECGASGSSEVPGSGSRSRPVPISHDVKCLSDAGRSMASPNKTNRARGRS
jgi:hypothetical protein